MIIKCEGNNYISWNSKCSMKLFNIFDSLASPSFPCIYLYRITLKNALWNHSKWSCLRSDQTMCIIVEVCRIVM